jgi:hypothetical protein
MSRKTRETPSPRLRPIDVPQEVIEKLASSLGIDEGRAVDLVISLHDEVRDQAA